jgi:hypothetical protein
LSPPSASIIIADSLKDSRSERLELFGWSLLAESTLGGILDPYGSRTGWR